MKLCWPRADSPQLCSFIATTNRGYIFCVLSTMADGVTSTGKRIARDFDSDEEGTSKKAVNDFRDDVVYVYDRQLLEHYGAQVHPERACQIYSSNIGVCSIFKQDALVDALIRAFGLTNRVCVTIIHQSRSSLCVQCHVAESSPASASDLQAYHSRDYVAALMTAESRKDDTHAEEYGLSHDCPVFDGCV